MSLFRSLLGLFFDLKPRKAKSRRMTKQLWYDILRKSKDFPQDIAERFLIADNIDPLKFKENHDYYIMDRWGGHKPTPSCFDFLDLPLGYPYWFASAYPDVVRYFSTVEADELIMALEDLGATKEDFRNYNPNLFDLEEDTRHFTVEVLYRLKEHFKKVHPNVKLECQ